MIEEKDLETGKSENSLVKAKPRKPYTKPRLEKVKLVLEEAVLGTGCKFPAGSGPGGSGCLTSGSDCLLAGS